MFMEKKKYKVLQNLVFAIGKQDYVCKPGDVIELEETHITTRALLDRKRIEPLPAPEMNPEPPKKQDAKPESVPVQKKKVTT